MWMLLLTGAVSMSRLLRTLLAVLLTTSFATSAVAQSTQSAQSDRPDDSTTPLPIERTIDFEAPLSIVGDLVGPGGEFLEAYRAPDGQSLVPNRVSFVDVLIESADQI
jgi:hypothetical protein